MWAKRYKPRRATYYTYYLLRLSTYIYLAHLALEIAKYLVSYLANLAGRFF